MKVFICGQRRFGLDLLKLCEELKCEIVGVCAPDTDTKLYHYAEANGYNVIKSGQLKKQGLPVFDLGLLAHSFDIIEREMLPHPSIGWLGYHPSLLPRHRGRSAIEWALRLKDPVSGGTLYWLNEGIDKGDIAYQDWRFIDHTKTAKELWDETLMPLGMELFKKALIDIAAGTVKRIPQLPLEKFATYGPAIKAG